MYLKFLCSNYPVRFFSDPALFSKVTFRTLGEIFFFSSWFAAIWSTNTPYQKFLKISFYYSVNFLYYFFFRWTLSETLFDSSFNFPIQFSCFAKSPKSFIIIAVNNYLSYRSPSSLSDPYQFPLLSIPFDLSSFDTFMFSMPNLTLFTAPLTGNKLSRTRHRNFVPK